MPKMGRIVHIILHSALLWGALATAGFYAVEMAGYLDHPYIQRYLAGHWAAYLCVAMFFIALAGLVIKLVDLTAQFDVLRLMLFDPIPPRGQPIADCPMLLQRLDKQPAGLQATYLLGRLRAGIEYIARKDSTETLEEELRTLSDLDVSRKHASYGLVRMMIWAIPFIGSLGTVVGIGTAVANLAPDASGNFVVEVTRGLEMVFDTTALALALSVVLMLGLFACDQIESRLLLTIDSRTGRELVGRFRSETTSKFGGGPAVPSNLSEMLTGAFEKLVDRQTELLKASLEASNKQWEERTETLAKRLGAAGGGGGGMAASPALLPGEAGPISEALMRVANVASEQSIPHELLDQINQSVAKGSRNWPARKALRTKERGDEPTDDAEGSDGSWFRAA